LLAALLEGQNLMRDEIAALRVAVETQARRRPDTDKASEALLEAINYELGSATFSAKSLVEYACREDPAEPRAALGEMFGGKVTPRRLGKWLGRMQQRGCISGRFTVDQLDDGQHRGGIWSVRMSPI
jgi:hypothetical protein